MRRQGTGNLRALVIVAASLGFGLLSCSGTESADEVTPELGAADAGAEVLDVEDQEGVADSGEELPSSSPFVVVSFNSGTSEDLSHDAPPDDGYGSEQALISDTWYGDGLSWLPAVEATTAFFAALDPDIVAFQEIFYAGECPDIPPDAYVGFFCETWSPGDPTVANLVLGEGWQVACNWGGSDKCAAVNRRFGTFAGCEEDFCLDGLTGFRVEGCGKSARAARGVIERVDGGQLTLVNVHGSSGFGLEDQACRVKQFDQVFVDLGDGEPAANGAENIIMGDFNTDPGRLAKNDPSAARINDFVGEGLPFHFVNEVGPDAPPSYAAFNIDLVISDVYDGDCVIVGATEGHPPVYDALYFDHKPIVCTVGKAP